MIYISGILLLGLSIFNISQYLIKKGRYKEVSDLLFYINAVVIIISTVYMAAEIPNENICTIGWLIPAWASSFFNLNLGVCQAGMLTALTIQLR